MNTISTSDFILQFQSIPFNPKVIQLITIDKWFNTKRSKLVTHHTIEFILNLPNSVIDSFVDEFMNNPEFKLITEYNSSNLLQLFNYFTIQATKN